MSDSGKTVIKVEGVSKTFKLPHEKTTSIKGAVINVFNRQRSFELQQALSDVSFEVKEGEFFGIVGRNGSGKSTLLKLLAGIYSPTDGHIHVDGKLTPFIELGVGFNPELTGRENVYLNGALLGFNRREMNAMYDEIVAFAEIERFMDQKLKNYSSGMQVRLAFSIAIRARSSILILDEVLAVGDEAFQQKCIDVFEEYKAQKQTVVLVTHDMETVRRFCTRAMLISNGKMTMIGEPSRIAAHYSELNNQTIEEAIAAKNQAQDSPIKARLLNTDGKAGARFKSGDTMRVELSWPAELTGVKNAGIAIIKNSGEYIYGANTFEGSPGNLDGKVEYDVRLQLGPGKYHIMAGLFGARERDAITYLEPGPEFVISPQPSDKTQGMMRLEHRWSTGSDKHKAPKQGGQ